jgi:hypothetical protein
MADPVLRARAAAFFRELVELGLKAVPGKGKRS